jgi:hypothetical protein
MAEPSPTWRFQDRAISAPTANPAPTSQSQVGNLCQIFTVFSLQPAYTLAPLTTTGTAASGAFAGPVTTAPVFTSNWLP